MVKIKRINYWNIRFKCLFRTKVKLRTYGESCENDWSLPCDYSVGLICPTVDNICEKCPNNILSYHCDCPLYKWWNGTHCGNSNLFPN